MSFKEQTKSEALTINQCTTATWCSSIVQDLSPVHSLISVATHDKGLIPQKIHVQFKDLIKSSIATGNLHLVILLHVARFLSTTKIFRYMCAYFILQSLLPDDRSKKITKLTELFFLKWCPFIYGFSGYDGIAKVFKSPGYNFMPISDQVGTNSIVYPYEKCGRHRTPLWFLCRWWCSRTIS